MIAEGFSSSSKFSSSKFSSAVSSSTDSSLLTDFNGEEEKKQRFSGSKYHQNKRIDRYQHTHTHCHNIQNLVCSSSTRCCVFIILSKNCIGEVFDSSFISLMGSISEGFENRLYMPIVLILLGLQKRGVGFFCDQIENANYLT